MYSNDDVISLRAALQDAIQAVQQAAKGMLALRTEMGQREQAIRGLFNQELQSLRNTVTESRREVSGIVSGAKDQIAEEAKRAVAPVAAEYGRAVSATSAHLRGASKTVWLWFAAGGGILLLVLLVGWALLGYYRRELTAAKDELRRYENAVPVVRAFVASDAIICGDRICVNIDPKGQKQGDKRQYRQAKPRPGAG